MSDPCPLLPDDIQTDIALPHEWDPDHYPYFYYSALTDATETTRRLREADREREASSDISTMKLDEVPPECIGCLRIHELFKAAPKCCLSTLRHILGDQHDQQTGGLTSDPKAPVRITPTKESLAEMVRTCGLFMQVPDNYNPITIAPRGTIRTARAKVFTVPKSNGKLRIIVDSRPANATLRDTPGFGMFTIERLLERFQVQCEEGGFYALVSDFRHWFHQLTLPERYRQFFLIQVGDKCYVPRTVPMGWKNAAAIAQGSSWAVILAWCQTNLDLRAKLGIPNYVFEQETLPTWIPLTCGGGIFLILDNLLILSKNEKIIQYWAQHLQRSTQCFKAVVKQAPSAAAPTGAPRGTRDFPYVHLARENDNSFDFMGITFRFQARRLAFTTQLLPIVSRSDSFSRRELASIVGKIFWSLRVRGQLRCFHEELSAMASCIGSLDAEWHTVFRLSVPAQAMLKKYAAERDANEWAPLRSMTPFQGVTAFVDAAFLKCLAGVVILRGLPDQQQHTIDLASGPRGHINVLEARAVLELIRLVHKIDPHVRHFRIATDSLVVFHAIERRSSKSPAIREVLRLIFEAIADGRIEMRFVPGDINPADVASRFWVGSREHTDNLPDFRKRMTAALPRLQDWLNDTVL